MPSLEVFHLIKQVGIYKITNLPYNKVYIGQSTDLHKRRIDHFKKSAVNARPKALHRDIQRLGKENFDFSILEYCTKDKLDTEEKKWIVKYFQDGAFMYNRMIGAPTNADDLKEAKKKQFHEMNVKNWQNPAYRANKSKQLSKIQKKRLQDPAYLAKKSAELKKYTDSLKKKVGQYTKDGKLIKIYNGVREAERQTGVDSRTISAVCLHKPRRKTAGGYKWKYLQKGVETI